MAPNADLTCILDEWLRGDRTALDRLMPHIYPDLHALARYHMSRMTTGVTLQTTALVGELFLRLLADRPEKIESRGHFYAMAARLIRFALVDHYRQSAAEKRGGDRRRVPLHEELTWVDANSAELLSFHLALSELEELDPQQADLFQLRFLAGCTAAETARFTGLSKATVDRKVTLARAWLFRRLKSTQPQAGVGAPDSESIPSGFPNE